MNGTITILSVGEGDLKLSFNSKDPGDKKRASATITDLLKTGYAIMVQVGTDGGEPIYKRATKFDPKTDEYIVMATPGVAPGAPATQSRSRKGAPNEKKEVRVPVARTKAVAVARTAGGFDPMLLDRVMPSSRKRCHLP